MKINYYLVLVISVFVSADVKAENPWGPECKTVAECIESIHAPSSCEEHETVCKNNEQNEALQGGLFLEFEKFGKDAIPALLEVLGTGNALEVARAAEALRAVGKDLRPEHASTIHAAWRRVKGSAINMLASSNATPAFAREVMDMLRREPIPDSDIAHVFSNFREYPDETPDGITAAVTEHIECSRGEKCFPAYAKLQFEWIASNAKSPSLGAKLAEALANPDLDESGKIAALEFFRPSQYFRTKEEMREVSLPVLRQELRSPFQSIRLKAAGFLTGYGDVSGSEVLLRLAEGSNSKNRIEALVALAEVGSRLQAEVDRVRSLLTVNDMDVKRHTTILLNTIGGTTKLNDLISQINSKDWLTTYSAVSALRESKNSRAQAALKNAAESYWHPVVEHAARQRLSTRSRICLNFQRAKWKRQSLQT